MEWLTLTYRGFPSVEIGSDDGMTILVRDRAQDDKLVKVLEPLDTVELTYKWDTDDEDMLGRLMFVKTNYPDYNGVEVTQIHKLYYGPYLDQYGNIQSVLQKIRQSTNFGKSVLENVKKIRTCKQCPVFDDLDEEIAELNKNNGGEATTWEWKN